MIPPITREEKYMYEIVGAGETAPEKPLTRKEIFYAVILGEDRTVPRPITNVEKYLATLAGAYSETLPFPTTRIEKFLAKAAGMDIETPVPVTREEIFWDNYSAAQKFEGILPIVFTSKGKSLKNYRIYGQTVDGESVGDLVNEGEHAGEYRVPVTVEGKNLWDEIYTGIVVNTVKYRSIAVHNGMYTLSSNIDFGGSASLFLLIGKVTSGANTNSNGVWDGNSKTINVLDGYLTIGYRIYGNKNPEDCEVQLEKGSVATDYEPYHEPITTNLYLPEPLKMAGNEAEYVDFEEQKQYFADGTSVDVELPTLPTIAGTNILFVDTQVQPSKVYVEGNIKTV